MNAENTRDWSAPGNVRQDAGRKPTELCSKETEDMVQWLHGLVASRVWYQMEIWLRQHCPAQLAGKESASDIIQSAFRRAHANVGQCAGGNDEERAAWFRAIVRNKLQETIKRYSSDKRNVGRERANVAVDGDAVPAAAACGYEKERWPDAEVIRQEIRGVVKQVVGSLPEDQMRVVHLRFYENLSRAEIAKRLGISPGAVANRMRVALCTLREALSEQSDVVT